MSRAQCDDEASTILQAGYLLDTAVGWFVADAAAGDIWSAQDSYATMAAGVGTVTQLISDYRAACGHYDHALSASFAGLAREASSAWRGMQAVCRADLAPLGFDC